MSKEWMKRIKEIGRLIDGGDTFLMECDLNEGGGMSFIKIRPTSKNLWVSNECVFFENSKIRIDCIKSVKVCEQEGGK